ncbi:MAG TPA: hypothetical protein VNZ57_04425 [Longimicrobiales bacterium]|nr:hypothetical protein [Longimicrobiales bacterium]
MSPSDPFFRREAASHADRLAALLRDTDASSPIAVVPELLRSSHGLLNCLRLGGDGDVVRLAESLESAARAIAGETLPWEERTRRAFLDTVDAVRALVDGTVTEVAGDLLSVWKDLGVSAATLAGGVPGPDSPAAVPGPDDLPREVVSYFRSQARTVLDRARRIIGASGDDERETAKDLLPIMTELQDLASTFSFVAVEELAERTISALVDGELSLARELVDVLHRTVFDSDDGVAASGEDRGGDNPSPVDVRDGDGHPDEDPPQEITGDVALAGEHSPAPVPDQVESDEVVPIEALCYGGAAALRRALELEAAVRGAMPADPEARGAAEEVFDLIRIALADEARAAEL